PSLTVFLGDGRVEIDSNAVEREMRPIALNRKSALFAGHDAWAENWAMIASLIGACKLNAVDPHAWLDDTLRAIVAGQQPVKQGTGYRRGFASGHRGYSFEITMLALTRNSRPSPASRVSS
ncbi:MAG: hypothetical protein ACI9ZH_001087, partial [Paracoccaceae bacterium]